MSEKRKIVLVGTGFVGMSMAYSFLSTGGIDELVLLDVAKEKAVGGDGSAARLAVCQR